MNRPLQALVVTSVLTYGLIAGPGIARAGGVLGVLESAFTSGNWTPDWSLNSQSAQNNGASNGYVQESLYGKIVSLEATLPDDSVIDISSFKIDMATGSDIIAVENGDYLDWFQGTTLLSCDSQRATNGVPSEFLAVLNNSTSLRVIEAGDPSGTYVTAVSISFELSDDISCP